MGTFFSSYQLLFATAMIAAVMALSQFVVLKADVFSVAPIGIQAIGAYLSGYLQVARGWSAFPSLLVAVVAGLVVSLVLAVPLARLRGIFQAIATLSVVILVQSLILIFDGVTGGPNGINGIPQSQTTSSLAVYLVIAIAVLLVVNRSRVGRAFDAMREDEIAAASHGVSIFRYQTWAFGISGLLAGLAGALSAGYNFSVLPESFGFAAVVATLTYVVIGGSVRVGGPLFGTALLLALPEISRPLADQRLVLEGALLVLTVIFLPNGVVDGLALRIQTIRSRRQSAPMPDIAVAATPERPPPPLGDDDVPIGSTSGGAR